MKQVEVFFYVDNKSLEAVARGEPKSRKFITEDIQFKDGWFVMSQVEKYLNHGDDPTRPRRKIKTTAFPSSEIFLVNVIDE